MHAFVAQQKPKFDDAVTYFKNDIGGLRTGRASAVLVEDVKVPAYGSMIEVRGLGNISVPDAKTIVIDPWDKSLLQEVAKALTEARVGANPVVDGTIIRLTFPPMTEDSRKQVVKILKEKLEEARISARKVRETIREEIIAKEKAGTIGEDERFRMQDDLENLTKETVARIESLAAEKEKEVMTI